MESRWRNSCEDQTHKEEEVLMTTLKGIILPADWDENGAISAISLSTFDEEEYRVEMDEKGEQLLAWIREEVEVTGTVHKDNKGKKIKVKDCKRNP